jgi:phosphatidylserine decarboxylase
MFPLMEMTKTDILKTGSYLVGIEMSILDVHVNRAPIEGKIIYQKIAGRDFLSLRETAALMDNERVTTVIDNQRFKIGVIQIASRLVRRIVLYLTEGDDVERGQRIGMIRFGSQVDVVIPKLDTVKLCIHPGDRVKAGLTILCKYEILT